MEDEITKEMQAQDSNIVEVPTDPNQSMQGGMNNVLAFMDRLDLNNKDHVQLLEKFMECQTEHDKMEHDKIEREKDRQHDSMEREKDREHQTAEKEKDREYNADEKAKDREQETTENEKDRTHETVEKRKDRISNWFSAHTKLLLTVAVVFIPGFAFLYKRHRRSANAIVPFSANDCKGKDHKEVKKLLSDAGFKKISESPSGDLKKKRGFLNHFHGDQDGSVTDVSINGNTSFKKKETFPKNAKIKIAYHSYEEEG